MGRCSTNMGDWDSDILFDDELGAQLKLACARRTQLINWQRPSRYYN